MEGNAFNIFVVVNHILEMIRLCVSNYNLHCFVNSNELDFDHFFNCV